MTILPAIEAYLAQQGTKYLAPAKAGPEEALMVDLKRQGQAARQEFTSLARLVQEHLPNLSLERTSNWMNQAQILRPHFWAYLKGFGDLSEPMFALRLYGDTTDFGVSVEVSFIERKKDEQSLIKQNRILNQPLTDPLYYLAQIEGESQVLEGTEANRQLLQKGVKEGKVRKVLVKYNVAQSQADSLEDLAERLAQALKALVPYYELTRDF
ncbi:ribonuclease P [Streptococcus oricebi]|uniref:Ribonuclease P n=1 Tax=Streptococcus oricebi TaxID=1547447 RepID=A0ABS5B4R6_9STRE|nr:ribonuclease P [Streptococcus oricebi]MBP2623804.1 ribonuclease P [Streptococcus oricebi]